MNINILWIILGLLLIVIFILSVFIISPFPAIALAKSYIFKVPSDNRPSEYIDGTVLVKVGLKFNSKYKNNHFDLYTPKYQSKNIPTIVWVHGGGFIGGDKLEEKEYATKLATLGYTVVVMNYELVPQTIYPRPVIQVSEFIRFLSNNSENYSLNMNNIFIAGDSAGAQIASQFIATQTNDCYRTSLGISKVLEPDQIRGALLYCGPYSILNVFKNSKSLLFKFIFGRIAWCYLNKKNWRNSDLIESTIVGNFITTDFPPSYITDGNNASFESQGKELIKVLEVNNVPFKKRFFDSSEMKVSHEYQFDLISDSGKIAFEDTIAFLKQYQS